ncbi:MAG: hypothetical protein QXJ41_14020, partial [Saccharolobus sp.]|uniref:hypothetical protein n=1 Tax=Saccharolobus sp. TaxID=2100761 RepID=UPI00317A7B88
GEQSIIEDLNNLVANCITFEEMTKNHCRIPQMGSVSHINDKTVKENLLPLLLSRLKEPMQGLPHGMGQSELLPIKSEKDIENNAVRKARDLLNFNPNESEEQLGRGSAEK